MSAVPSNAVPSNAVPTNAVPTNAVPTGDALTDAVPSNPVPPKAAGALRLVAWNARGGFDGPKFDRLRDELGPDVAVVPESCNKQVLLDAGRDVSHSIITRGARPKKLLGVHAFNDFTVEPIACEDGMLERFLPGPGARSVRVHADRSVVPVEAPGHRCGTRPAEEPARTVPEVYAELFAAGPLVVAGDFNHSASFDEKLRPRRRFERSNRVLEQAGLVSAYHRSTGEGFGEESKQTLWFAGGRHRHIDFVYVPSSWEVRTVWLGDQAGWNHARTGSDHAPVVVDVVPSVASPR